MKTKSSTIADSDGSDNVDYNEAEKIENKKLVKKTGRPCSECQWKWREGSRQAGGTWYAK